MVALTVGQKEILTDLRKQLVNPSNVVFVLGAGVSVNASAGAPTAGWVGLLEDGIRHCETLDTAYADERAPWWRQRLDEGQKTHNPAALIDVAEDVTQLLRSHNEYDTWLQRSIGDLPLRSSTWIKAINRLGVGLATTNYDSLIERAIKREDFVTWRNKVDAIRKVLMGERRAVFHLHGHHSDPSSVVFGHGAYHEILSDRAAQEMQRVFALGKSLVFLGYGTGLDDPNFSNLLKTLVELGAGLDLRSYYRLVRDDQVAVAPESHSGDNFSILSYGKDYSDLPDFIRTLAPDRARAKKRKSLWEGVPGSSSHPLTGREVELSQAVEQLRAHQDVAMVGGLPGVGKTALAVALARDKRLRRAFPGGVLWIGLGQRPDLFSKLMRWAKPLGIPPGRISKGGSTTEQLDGARLLVAQSLLRKRCLLILDDAWSYDDAAAFRLGGQECAHLLTTRFLDIGGRFVEGEPLRIAELEPQAAFALLEQVAPNAARTHRAELIRLLPAITGGLPIAVLIVAQHLRSISPPFLDEAVEAFEDLGARIALLEERGDVRVSDDVLRRQWCMSELIGMSEQLLDDDAKQALRDLAVFAPKVNTFSVEAAECVSGGSPKPIRALVGAGLVEPGSPTSDDMNERLQMHQVVSDYARSGLAGDEDSFVRLAEFFADYLAASPQSGQQLTAWFNGLELELQNLDIAYSWALTHNRVDEALSIAAGLGQFWYERSRFSEGTRWNSRLLTDEVLDKALSLDAAKHLAKAVNDLGNFAFNQGDLDRAQQHYADSFARRRRLPGHPEIAGSLNNLSLIHRLRGQFSSARKMLLAALRINRKEEKEGPDRTRARMWAAMNLNNLGLVALAIADVDAAMQFEEESIKVFQGLGSDWGVAMASCDLAHAALAVGRHDNARESILRSLRLRRLNEDARGIATSLRAFAHLDSLLGQTESSQSKHLAALSGSVDLADAGGAAEGLYALAGLAAEADPDQAVILARTAASYLEEQKIVPGMIVQHARERLKTTATWDRAQSAARDVLSDGQLTTLLSSAQIMVDRYSVDPLELTDEILGQAS